MNCGIRIADCGIRNPGVGTSSKLESEIWKGFTNVEAIILLGAPGSGKGTTAEKIRAVTGYVHVSTGDMLREAVRKETRVGHEAESFMERGALVPDEIMIRLVEERLDSGSNSDLYMFDGFPRTIAQAELLEKSLRRRGVGISHVFFLDTPRQVLIERLSGRRICRKCGVNYHVVNMPPKTEGVCDACGGELYQRPDDQKKTIIKRLEVYNRQTEGLISRYEEQNLLVRIDSNQSVEKIILEIVDMLKNG